MDEQRKEECMKRVVVLFMSLVSVLFLCACKDDIIQRARNADLLAESFDGKPVMRTVRSKDFEQGNMAVRYCYYEGSLYYLMPSDEGYGSYKILKYNMNSGKSSDVADVYLQKNDKYVLNSVDSLYITPDGITVHCLIRTSGNIATDKAVICKVTYDMDGKKKSEVRFEDYENSAMINNCFIDSEGNSYLVTLSDDFIDSYLVKYDASGRLLCDSKLQEGMFDAVLCNDRPVAYLCGMDKDDLGYYDMETGTFGATQYADVYPKEGNSRIVGTYDENVLVMNEKRLYSYSMDSGELTALVDLEEDDIGYNSVNYVKQVSDDELIIIYSPDSINYRIMYYGPVEDRQ